MATATGRITTAKITVGTKLLLAQAPDGHLRSTTRKVAGKTTENGHLIVEATVTGIEAGLTAGRRRATRLYTLTTDQGVCPGNTGAQTHSLAPSA